MDFCSIASGSSGNCTYAGTDKTAILVDAGISARQIEKSLGTIDRAVSEISGILVTHEHSDHIKGLGVLSRRYGIPIYGTKGTLTAIANCGSLGRIDSELFHEIHVDQDFQIGDITVHPFEIPHDAAAPSAYRLSHEKTAVAVVTDLGVFSDYIVENMKGLDAVLLEANHDIRMLQAGPYPYYLKQRILGTHGHLSNENAGRLLCRILHDNLKQVFLGHLSKENNYDALAYETVCMEVTMGENPYKASDFHIHVADRSEISQLVTV